MESPKTHLFASFSYFQMSVRSTQKLVEIQNIVRGVGCFGTKYTYNVLGLANYGTCFIGGLYLKIQFYLYFFINV